VSDTFAHNKSIPAAVRQAHALPDDLVRLSIGIEDERDLVQDLLHALGEQGCQTPSPEFELPGSVVSGKGV